MKKLLSHYWVELSITAAAWILVGWKLGLSAFILTFILSVLEITLSADNAVVNSRVLIKLSSFWQKMFLTVGIVIAVFAVRFALPILIVSLTASLDLGTVFSLAINDPAEYGHKLHEAAPLIDGFGGIFLLMVGVFFFVDASREVESHWLRRIEKSLAHLGRFPFSKAIVAIVLSLAIFFILPASLQGRVGVSMALGVITYLVLHGVTSLMERYSDKERPDGQVGWTAFALFIYLQVLDASFSLDGVVGAFALTTNIVIIMAGLGIGALWVRTMTLYMVRHETLSKYIFIESGAHWAILALAGVMILKLFSIELPELVVGTIGLVFIVAALISSVRRRNVAPHAKR